MTTGAPQTDLLALGPAVLLQPSAVATHIGQQHKPSAPAAAALEAFLTKWDSTMYASLEESTSTALRDVTLVRTMLLMLFLLLVVLMLLARVLRWLLLPLLLLSLTSLLQVWSMLLLFLLLMLLLRWLLSPLQGCSH